MPLGSDLTTFDVLHGPDLSEEEDEEFNPEDFDDELEIPSLDDYNEDIISLRTRTKKPMTEISMDQLLQDNPLAVSIERLVAAFHN